MVQKILLSIILLFTTVNPFPLDKIEQSQVDLAPVTKYFKILEKIGYNLEKDITIEFNGDNIPFFSYNGDFYAVLSSGVDQSLGGYDLKIKNEPYVLFSKKIKVLEYDFPEVFQNTVYDPAGLSSSQLTEINKKKESLFDALERRSKEKLWETPFQYPLKNIYITSDFGRKRIYTNYETQHKGTDFRAPVGTDVYPMSEGKVLWTAKEPLYFEGKAVIVDHGQGIVSIYLHLNDVLVNQGDFVGVDDVIAKTGNTGLSTGPHLHLDARIWKNRIDPVDLIEKFKNI